MIAEHLGTPDSRFPDEEVGFGAERAYLGGIGIPELRDQNQGAASVYRQVKREQLGQYIKIVGFPWFLLLDRDIAENQDVAWAVTRHGEIFVEVRNVYLQWRDLALVQARAINTGPAVLEDQ